MQLSPDTAMMMRGMLLGGAEREQVTTSKVIAAIPDQNHDYKPDDKSKTAMELAEHIATVDCWFLDSIAAGAFSPESMMKPPAGTATGAQMSAWYNEQFKASAAKIKAMDADALMKVVDFFGMMQMPAVTILTLMNNHMIHHRGQLSTYLRAMGGKCPSIYGPSADEEVTRPAAAAAAE
ncbi:MAG: DinB family protein [Bryobacteraceae bacterium]